MRMTRGIIALILALAMLMPFGVSAKVTTAAEATAEIADPGVDLLIAIGVVEEEEAALTLDSYMTRAEFSMILCRLRGYDTMGQGMFGENYFTDVAEDSYEKGYIAAAVTTGLMDPVGDKLFAPDYPVTRDAVVKGLVSVLGYRDYIEATSGGIERYYTCANSLGLLKSVTKNEEYIQRHDIYQLVINALDCEVLKMDSLVDGNIQMVSGKDINILTEYLKIESGQGIITATEYTALAGKKTGKGIVKIDGKEFAIGTVDCKGLIGYNVKYYYSEDTTDKMLLRVVPYKNEVLTIDAKKLVGEPTRMTYTYYDEDNDKKTASFSEAHILYNQERYDGTDYSVLAPENGTITMIDNNHDGEYEVVVIDAYIIMVVDIRNDYDYEILGKYGDRISLKPEDHEKIKYFDEDGNEVQFTSIGEENVLSIFESADGRYISVIVGKSTVSGTLESISKGDNECVIDGVTYEFAEELVSAVNGGMIASYIAGKKYTFYLTHTGDIMYYKEESSDLMDTYNYGIITAANKGHGIDGNLTVRMYTLAGEFEDYKLPKGCIMDGKKINQNDELYRRLCIDYEIDAETEKSAPVAQLVRYKINTALELTEIDFIGAKTAGDNSLFKSFDNTNATLGVGFTSNLFTFGGKVAVDKSAKMFRVPMNEDGSIAGENRDGFAVLGYNDFKNVTGSGVGGRHHLKAYSSNPDTLLSEIIITKATLIDGKLPKEIPVTNPQYVVLDITTALTDDGDVATKIKYGNTDAVKTAFLDSDLDINAIELADGTKYKVKEGDMIRFATDFNNNIYIMEPVYDYENDRFLVKNQVGKEYAEFEHIYSHMQFISTYFQEISGDFAIMVPKAKPDFNMEEDPFHIIKMTGYTFYFYDHKRGVIERATLSDLRDMKNYGQADRMFAFVYYFNPAAAIIYR